MKLHNLKKTAKDRKADAKTADQPLVYDGAEGSVPIHLDHHHLSKMGLADGSLKAGGKVHFAGEGVVEHASSDAGEDGNERHSARIRLHKAGVDYEGGERDSEEDRKGLRAELEKAAK